MKNQLVSIILPTYNRVSLLPKAIKSCLDQTYKNIEIIVVDDGSNDNTENVVKKIIEKDSRVYYFKKENGGLPSALNYGFKQSKGNFLTWTSDDNLYQRDAIEEMLDYLVRHPKIVMVNANMSVVDEKNKKIELDMSKISDMKERNPIGACFMYRREVYEKIGDYNKDFKLAEDYDYWIRIWKFSKIGHLNRNLYTFGIRSNTLTVKENWKVQIMTNLLRYHHGFISIEDVSNFIIGNIGDKITFGDETNKIKILTKNIIENMISQNVKYTLIGDALHFATETVKAQINQNNRKLCEISEEKSNLIKEKQRLNEKINKFESSLFKTIRKKLLRLFH